MNKFSRVVTTLLVLSLFPRTAVAEDKLSCQADLRLPDCSTPGEVWNSSGPLNVGVTCQVCSVKGSEVSCSPEEIATAAGLSIETPAAKAVEGVFTEVGGCGLGVKLFQFGGSLTAGESYVLVLTAPPYERTAILNFSVATAISSRDGGANPGEAGPGGDSSGPSTEAGLPPARDGDAAGQEQDGGCGCRAAAGSPLSPGVFLVLLLLSWGVNRRRERRR